MADDLGSQLSVQQQINKVLQQRNALLAQQAKMLGTQIQLAAEYCKALECKDLDGMNDRLQEINASLQQVSEDASTSTDETNRLNEAAQQGSDRFRDLAENAKKFAVVAIGFKAIKAGLGGIVQTVTNIGSALSAAIGSVFKFGKSLLSLPFTLMGNLIGMAQGGGGGGGNPLKEALEETRKQFGSLASNEGAAAASVVKQFKEQSNDLAGTGLKMSKVFGRGKKGLAEALKYSNEGFAALGSQNSYFASEFKKSGVAIGMYRKGLGLTAEDMKGVADVARGQGQSLTGTLDSIANYSVQLGERFGIAAKEIAKDMSGMMKDYDRFGHLGPKVMAQNAVYARKLGIEIKSLTGMIDKFDNFEDAAKGAAQLSQAFGMNVDAMKMMKEEDPAKRLRMLQDAFAATGRSVADMTMQEKKLLAQQAGLDVKTVERAFSQKGLSESYDDIMGAGDDAEKKTLSQAEAMSKLADSIEKLTKGGGGGGKKFKSFFDAFTQGFGDGIMKHIEFKKVLKNITKSLKIVNKAGKQVGKDFVDMFPGVKKMMKGLQELFSPKRFKPLMESVKNLFRQFFTDIKSGKDGVPGFIEGLKKAFGKFFGAGKEGTTMFRDGFMEFIKAAGTVLKGILTYVLPQLTKGIKKLTEWLRENLSGKAFDDAKKSPFAKALTCFFGAIGELFSVIFKPMLEKLGSAIVDLFKMLWKEKLKPWLRDNWKKVALGAAAIIIPGFVTGLLSFGKGLIMMAIGKLFLGGDGGDSMFKKIGGALRGGVTRLGGTIKTGIVTMGKGVGKAFARVAPGMAAKVSAAAAKVAPRLAAAGARLVPGVGLAAAVLLTGKDINKAVDRMSGDLEKKYGETEGKFAAGTAGLINALTLGLLPDSVVDKIGEFTAGIAQKLGNFFDDIGLGGVYDALLSFVSLAQRTLGGLYDIIVGIFSGDPKQVTKGLQRIFDAVLDLIKKLPQAILDLAGLIGKAFLWVMKQAFMLVFVYIPKGILMLLRGIGTAIAGVFGFIGDAFKALFADIEESGGFGSWVIEKFEALFSSVWEGITGVFSGAFDYFKEWVAGVIQSIYEAWGGEGDITEPIITFFDAIKYAFGAVVDFIMGIPGAIVDAFVWMGEGIWNGIKWVWEGITDAWNATVDAVADGIEVVVNFFKELGADIANVFTSAWEGIVSIWEGFTEWFNEKIEAVKELFTGWYNSVSQSVSNAWNKVTSVFSKMGAWFGKQVDKVVCGFASLKDKMIEKVKSAWEGIKNWILEKPVQLGKDIVNGIKNGLINLKDMMVNMAKGAWKSVKAFFGIKSPSKEGLDAGHWVSEGMAQGFAEVEDKIKGTAENALLAIQKVFSGDNVVQMLKPVVDGFVDAFEFIYTSIGELFKNGLLPPETLEGLNATLSGVVEMIQAFWMRLKPVIENIIVGVFDLVDKGISMFFKLVDKFGPRVGEMASAAFDMLAKVFNEENAIKLGKAIVNGIAAGLKMLGSIAKHAFQSMFEGVKSWLGISSPSKTAMEMLGGPIADGIDAGLSNNLKKSAGTMKEFMDHGQALMDSRQLNVGVSGIEENAKALQSVHALAEGTGQLHQSLENLAKAAPEKNKGLYDSVEAVVHNIETLGGVLEGKAGAGAVQVVEAFKSGKMTVKHTLPNTKVEVVVHLDKRVLGKELVRTTLPGKQKIATTTG